MSNKKQESSKALLSPEEQAAEEAWRNQFSAPQQGRFNTITLVNKKFDAETDDKNPDFGKIFAVSYDEGGNEEKTEVKEGDSFFPVVVRDQITCKNYVDDPKKTGPSGKPIKKAEYWCREVEQGQDIELMNADGEVVYTGPYRDAKEKYNLKYKKSLYVRFGDKFYRWKIGGKDTLSSWFGISNEISRGTEPREIVVKKIHAQSNNGIFWNDIEFGVGEKVKASDVMSWMKEVRDALEVYYKDIEQDDKPDFLDEPKSDKDSLDMFDEDAK